ncbi:MAG: NUDIX pyrophosphatase [Deltaproteobacteria bacterium]|jgi:8-oxo-dGTP pyrophosphatase MutT (NUDIX family)|nr:NUDIX pyrophosphatase [Deltaproteobacteria bacterium]
MTALKQKKVVTSFIRHRGKILLLRRSSKVGTYKGRWAGVSGYLEVSSPLVQALKEIYEETGLTESQVTLVSSGKPLEVPDQKLGVCWLVHPFLFETNEPEKIKLDWEHVEVQWVEPALLRQLSTVPKLAEAYERCGYDNESKG